MAREIVLENDACEAAQKDGWLTWKMKITGIAGGPDRWFFKRRKQPCPHCGSTGELKIVEFKKLGERPDGRQIKRHQELKAHGWHVYVIDHLEDFRKVFFG